MSGTIDVHIRRLRSKLGRLSGTVRTVRGQGFHSLSTRRLLSGLLRNTRFSYKISFWCTPVCWRDAGAPGFYCAHPRVLVCVCCGGVQDVPVPSR